MRTAGDPGPLPYVKFEASGVHIDLRQLIDAGELIGDLLDVRLFLWDILDSLFLIPQLWSFVFVYTVIKGFG